MIIKSSLAFMPTSRKNNFAFQNVQIQSSLKMSNEDNTISLVPTAKQKKKKLKTFLRYLQVESWRNEDIRDLETVLVSIGDACKQINRIVQRAQTDDLYGAATIGVDGLAIGEDGTNIQGEVQQKLDVLCNTIFMRALCGCSTGTIAAVASEEEDVPRSCADVMVRTYSLSKELL